MPDNLEPLLYWVKEREQIRLRRAEGLAAPWTDDEILATFRFCNVRRCEDRVSSWLRQNVLTERNMKKAGLPSFLMFAAFCRWCNWPPTIKAIMDAKLWPAKSPNWRAIGALVDKLGRSGKVWTGAYLVRASRKKGLKKGKFVAVEVIGKHYAKIVPELVKMLKSTSPTYQGVHALICKADNFGTFMAGQVAGDLTYTRLLSGASDLQTWAPMGPGSVRGFNRIMQNPGKLSKRPSEELWLEKLQAWRAAVVEHMGSDYEDLTALDCQNICCEIDKYLRVRNGEGRPRARYSTHEGQY